MTNEEDPHKLYVKKLKKIGRRLNFETKGLDTSTGRLDCVWRYKIPDVHREFSNLLKNLGKNDPNDRSSIFDYGLPLVAFEVIRSEQTKQLKGSLISMISAKPSLAIFVLLKKTLLQESPNNQHNIERKEKNIKRLCQEFAGVLRTEVWHENEVDSLYDEVDNAYRQSA